MNNSALGQNAGLSITSGSGHVCIGESAGSNIVGQSNNICTGYGSNVVDSSITSSIAIGTNAVVGSSNTMQLGDSTLQLIKTPADISATGFVTSGSISAETVNVNGTLTTSAIVGNLGFQATIATGLGVGSGGSASINGTGICGQIIINTGAAPSASGVIAKITIPLVNGVSPFAYSKCISVVLFPANQFTASMPIASNVYVVMYPDSYMSGANPGAITNSFIINAITTGAQCRSIIRMALHHGWLKNYGLYAQQIKLSRLLGVGFIIYAASVRRTNESLFFAHSIGNANLYCR